ncbi:rho guanine nucleotide exchange factor 18-like isoform X2 [Scyliorhinus canicula]|uniref:rho guanine nucleotide exchange factor 18-like isoform X2 n=1 Tax=Scyliorhinus canicula TaxID=7830 RepID=UPI0018F30223|nr:rho guanine nucleotide exchange factor 18-like isoform X2 [Scyliorhinus canicula]
MADSPLNNSWPSFSKFWMKRLSFKKECKQCAHGFTKVQEPTLPACVNVENRSNSLSEVEEMYFNRMAEGKDDLFLDYDDSATDATSSLEDIPSLESSLQLRSLPFGDLTRCPVTSSSEDITRAGIKLSNTGRNNVASDLVACCPLQGTAETNALSLIQKAGRCGLMDGAGDDQNNSASDLENATDNEDQDSFPLLIRSMSSSRRHSWEGPLSPSALGDMRRRLSLDLLGIDSDGEGDREDEDQSDLSQDPSAYELAETLNSSIVSAEIDTQPTSSQEKTTSSMSEDKVKAATKMRPRLETGYSSSSKAAPSHSSRSLPTSQSRETESETSLGIQEEKENLEPNDLLVQQVLLELKAFHGQCNGAENSVRTASGSGKMPRSASPHDLTWMEFLAEKEGDEKCDRPEKGTKVKRTLSSLKNRVTGSFKDKGKTKEKEKESPKEKRKCNNGHQLVPGTFSSSTSCSLCSKPLSGKTGYQCMNCAVNVHKNCRTLLAECTTFKGKQKDSQQKHTRGSQSIAQHASSAKEQPRCPLLVTDGTPGAVQSIGMTIPPRRPSQPSSASANSITNHGITAGVMEQEVENGIPKSKSCAEETPSLSSSSAESLVAEDTIYASLKAELEADGQDFEAESWSLAVDQAYAKKQSKEVIKRQDVIYELMQTEMHHLRTLKIMLHVYDRGIEELQDSDGRRIFPCLHQLLEIHRVFFSRMKGRRQDSLEEGSEQNYLIQRIGDLLTQQFSGESGEEMKAQYGDFCGQHNEAVNYYKEMYQQNKKFQNLIKKLNNYSVVRRLGVQECILLVTQRITKYPVLVERIIQNTEAGSEDHEELTKALLLIKDTITQVDEKVSEHEKARRLKEIGNRMELKSIAKLKNGKVFRKIDMLKAKRKLLHEGVVCWKAASGRLKDILALVLSDVILLLQEKDQKYSFATVDQKPAGISLQKLIVREVANEEKGMFLISASDEGPEMYEIHTNSKEERNTWMAVIRDAIDRYPLEEAALGEERQKDEGRATRVKELQQCLSAKDEVIKRTLSEKLEIYSDIAEVNGYMDTGRPRVLLRADTLESPRDVILNEVVKEVENLQNLIAAQPSSISWQSDESLGSSGLPRRAETFGGYDSSSANLTKDGSIRKKSNTLSSSSGLKMKEKAGSRASSEPQLQDVCSDGESGRTSDLSQFCNISNSIFLHDAEFVQSVQMLTSQLYKVKVLIAQQDSYVEMQRCTGASGERDRQSRLTSSRGSLLLEQEKQRNVEKQREEWANVQKLQNQVRQEQQKWERERERQKRELDTQESCLQEREENLQQLKERLAQDQEELERHRQEYQKDLERLRESQRTVEKERERLEQRQRKQLKHGTAVFPTEAGQIPGFPHSQNLDGERLEVNPLALKEGGTAQHSLMYLGQSNIPVELCERPAEIQLHRENSTASMFLRTENRSSLGPKTEVPIHLVSATNQIMKHTGVQQKIPTKLATLKGGKDKGGKGKDRQTISGMPSFSMPHGIGSASGELRQSNPVKFFAKDDGTLKSRRSSSPVISSSQSFSHQESSVPVDIQHVLSTSMPSGNPQQPQSAPVAAPTQPQPPPPPSVQDDSATEIIFF